MRRPPRAGSMMITGTLCFCYFHAATRLNHGVFPVQVVHLQLDEVHVGVLCEYIVEGFGPIVDGKANIADFALVFHLADEIPHAVLVELCRTRASDIVQQVEVYVIEPKPVEGGLQVRVRSSRIGRCPGEAFRGNSVGVTRIAFHERLAQGGFRGAVVVDERGVEIRSSSLDEGVDHCFEMLDIDARGVLFVKKRQPHAAESEFRGVQKRFVHGFLSFVRMLTYCLEYGSSQAFFRIGLPVDVLQTCAVRSIGEERHGNDRTALRKP